MTNNHICIAKWKKKKIASLLLWYITHATYTVKCCSIVYSDTPTKQGWVNLMLDKICHTACRNYWVWVCVCVLDVSAAKDIGLLSIEPCLWHLFLLKCMLKHLRESLGEALWLLILTKGSLLERDTHSAHLPNCLSIQRGSPSSISIIRCHRQWICRPHLSGFTSLFAAIFKWALLTFFLLKCETLLKFHW